MREMFRTVAAIGRAWDDQVEEEHENHWRNQRNEELEKWYPVNMPTIAHTGMKAYEFLGLEEKLYKCNQHARTCSDFRAFQNDARTKTREKSYEYNQCEKSYFDLSERTQLREKTFVLAVKRVLAREEYQSSFNIYIHFSMVWKPPEDWNMVC
ncbi:zinc finger protein 431-like [Octodon degus]|uniref:Zinc finger protein 431-like n=1 Tax=Octodon degus TaxID=10160 RepID=A0A6P6DUS2_OCTDE|nr:zinc finger protein 431-like [Octodon degus]